VVRGVDSRVDPVTRSVRVRAILPNPEFTLKPGLLMRVELLLDPREALTVPEAAILHRGQEHFVLRVSEGETALTAERLQIRIGTRIPGWVEVRSGLAPGERVVTEGQEKVRPGQPIRLVAQSQLRGRGQCRRPIANRMDALRGPASVILSDISITRPVMASVLSLLLVAFGLVSFDRLPLRQFPDIDPPVVSIDTTYRGAAAAVVETRITQIIEERIAGVEGIRTVESTSEDGRSRISIEFNIDRDVDSAANDIRDRVSGIIDQLPSEADPPEIQKVDSNDDVIVWFNLSSERMTVPELSDYARRYLVDRFSVLDGVARVRVGGEQVYAMRVWLDRNALAARGLTVADVEEALRAENLELPAGEVESIDRQFSVRVDRAFNTPDDFARLVLARGEEGYLVRLGDVARVERGTEEERTFFRGNGKPMVGIGIIKQSTANTIAVAQAAKAEMERVNAALPEGMRLSQSFDSRCSSRKRSRRSTRRLPSRSRWWCW
jgi:hypothetical protein